MAAATDPTAVAALAALAAEAQTEAVALSPANQLIILETIKPQRKNRNYSNEALLAAIESVKNHLCIYADVEIRFGVPPSTVRKYVDQSIKEGKVSIISPGTVNHCFIVLLLFPPHITSSEPYIYIYVYIHMYVRIGRKNKLSVERERLIFDWIRMCDQAQRGQRRGDVLARVQRLGSYDNVKFDGRHGMPTRKWYQGFKKRWNIRILKQRRHTHLPPFVEHVREWFKVFYEAKTNRESTWNFDEKGFSRVTGPQWTCVAEIDYPKGSKKRPSVAGPEWGDHITLAACCNANAVMAPNLWILKGKSETRYIHMAKELENCFIVTSGIISIEIYTFAA